jgi:hypothetical protein
MLYGLDRINMTAGSLCHFPAPFTLSVFDAQRILQLLDAVRGG